MLRTSRLDIPGLLQHVMVRGIEKRDNFLDDEDRQAFVDRLMTLLIETETRCYAWALMPNHLHLLLLPTRNTLAQPMRRLLTGYVVTFNRRHDRVGRLFQNRYRSIVCEAVSYLLELVRFIHFNPLRSGLGRASPSSPPFPGAVTGCCSDAATSQSRAFPISCLCSVGNGRRRRSAI